MTLQEVNKRINTLKEYCRLHPNRNDVPAKRREIYDLNAWKEDYYWERKQETIQKKVDRDAFYKKRQKVINNRAISNEYSDRYTSTDFILSQLEDNTDVELAYHLSQMIQEPTYNVQKLRCLKYLFV